MNKKDTISLLQELAQSHRTDERDLAQDILKYMDDRSPEFQPIPAKNTYIAWEFGNVVCDTIGVDDSAQAVAEYICLSIKHGASGEARLVTRILGANDTAIGGNQLLKAAQYVGLSDVAFARYLLSAIGHRLQFGWTEKRPEQTIFGSAFDVRIFYDVPPSEVGGWSPVEMMIWNLSDEQTKALLQTAEGPLKCWAAGRYQGALAKFKPEVFKTHLETITEAKHADRSINWRYVLTATDRFDQECLHYTKLAGHEERLHALIFLDSVRDGKFQSEALETCLENENQTSAATCAYLADCFPVELTQCMAKALQEAPICLANYPAFIMISAFKACAQIWDDGGSDIYKLVAQTPLLFEVNNPNSAKLYLWAIEGIYKAEPKPSNEMIRQWCLDILALLKKQKAKIDIISPIWTSLAMSCGQQLEPELWQLLQDKSKTLKTVAVTALAKMENEATASKAAELLCAKKVDTRLGAAMLLAELQDASATEELKTGLANEESDKVRTAIYDALGQRGVSDLNEPTDEQPATRTLQQLEEIVERQAKKIKLPKGNWLKINELPSLKTSEGESLSELALTYLIQKQAKHKRIDAAGDIQPFLPLFNRSETTPFAIALYQQWLDSDQSASDRWVLSLTGLLSDKRVIPELIKPIKNWAENARHKLAEYAAQAVSLIPGDEALMVLDGLANRYRSKFKNIGKACREALNKAALERGVSMDELGDMIVPNFEFDEVGQRSFNWGEVTYIAQLNPDFKLTWIDEESEKEQKSLPSSMPTEVKDEVKALNKLIRETVKGQTQRLELNLVRQRRWVTKRWSELFENHPLLQSFAANLVWGAYNDDGKLLRTFRRYPNGLLANADGELIELNNDDKAIGMMHPLELEAEELDRWKEHLGRFKIKPPFPQLDRPTVVLEANHSNRKEISFTKGKTVSYGTFRSRMERLGWIRGSVIDAGGISSYYKDFPGAGVEIFLYLEECWVGMDPMDTVRLECALFAKGETIKRGSYEYDEPNNQDDPRVLSFGKIPPVVYSEVISDLKTIIGET